MAAAAWRTTSKRPTRLTSTARRNTSRGKSVPSFFTTRWAGLTPAQFTHRSIRPNASAAWATALATWSVSVTSAGRKMALSPTSEASSAPRDPATSRMAAEAPSAASMRTTASPRPEAPPVTSPTAPLTCIVSSLYCRSRMVALASGSPHRPQPRLLTTAPLGVGLDEAEHGSAHGLHALLPAEEIGPLRLDVAPGPDGGCQGLLTSLRQGHDLAPGIRSVRSTTDEIHPFEPVEQLADRLLGDLTAFGQFRDR